MLSEPAKNAYPILGTTPPFFIPCNSDPKIIRKGEHYFFVQIYSAQAAFWEPFWAKVKALVVTSQVALSDRVLNDQQAIKSIQRSRQVQRERAEQLGLSPNLISLTPATMSHFSISIDYLLDKENSLNKLVGMINRDAFVNTVSLASGSVLLTRTVGKLAQELLENFLPPEGQEPILQFSGDFNLANGLEEGYWVIIGTQNERTPLPNPWPTLTVDNRMLFADGQLVTQYSYIILEIRCVEARTRALHNGAEWESNLQTAEDIAAGVGRDPLATQETKRAAWEQCLAQLQQAQTFLRKDPNYLRSEAENIIKLAFKKCFDTINFGEGEVGRGRSSALTHQQLQEQQQDRVILGLPPDEDLAQSTRSYLLQQQRSRSVVQQFKDNA